MPAPHYLWLSLTLLLALLISCEDSPVQTRAQAITLIGEGAIGSWENAELTGGGEILSNQQGVELGVGAPMTGAHWVGDLSLLPLESFVIEMEAMRLNGDDFFAALTFPIGSLDTPVTLILGGWGGGLVGISSIDHLDASENNTASEQSLQNNHWYAVRITLKDQHLEVRIDERIVIATSLKGKHLGLKPGEIDRCAPLGLATWRTTGVIRQLNYRPTR